MYQNQEIADNLFYVGVNDRLKEKFENLISLPYGVSYNSYLIVDEKTALFDTVDICYVERFLDRVISQLKGKKLDYLIVNHMEPDHSGSISMVMRAFPEMQIIGNRKTLEMLEGFYGITDNVIEIEDGEELSLGKKQLQFHLTPMVHWPETMMVYEKTEKLLFSGDGFGCFGALNGGVLDTELNLDIYWDEMIRYYANIVGKYGAPVQKALKKLAHLDIAKICSTHGPVWCERVAEVVDMYDKLSRYAPIKEGVVVVYGSMYGNTEMMAETVAQGLSQAGVRNVIVHNASKSDISFMLSDIFKHQAVIIGSPTYNNELYPEIDALVRKLEFFGIKDKKFGYFGSFTWAPAALKRLRTFAETMKWPTPDFEVQEKQALKSENYERCLELGHKVAEMIKEK